MSAEAKIEKYINMSDKFINMSAEGKIEKYINMSDKYINMSAEGKIEKYINMSDKYATVMFSTGPMFVTVQYVLHHMKKGVFVLPTNLYGKYEKGPDALMEHLHGSSWHGNDAKGVFFIEHHWKALLAIAGVALVVAAWLLLRSYGGVKRSTDSTVAALTSIQSRKE
eukprot:gene19948-26656_t